MDKACCFTGYRPEKFPFLLRFGESMFMDLESRIYDAVFSAVENGIKTFYCGMAAGFDLLCGRAVVELKRMSQYKDIKLVAVIPFLKQSERFHDSWKKLYDNVLSESDERILISEEYQKWCFSERNHYMVDRSKTVITYYDGQRGGTENTLRYAARKGRKIVNLADYDLSDFSNEYSGIQLEI